jgi:hypothetical protein
MVFTISGLPLKSERDAYLILTFILKFKFCFGLELTLRIDVLKRWPLCYLVPKRLTNEIN